MEGSGKPQATLGTSDSDSERRAKWLQAIRLVWPKLQPWFKCVCVCVCVFGFIFTTFPVIPFTEEKKNTLKNQKNICWLPAIVTGICWECFMKRGKEGDGFKFQRESRHAELLSVDM